MDIKGDLTRLNAAERAALKLKNHTDEEAYTVAFIDTRVSQALGELASAKTRLEMMQGEDVPMHQELGRARSDYATLQPHETTLHQMAGEILRHQLDTGL